MRVVFDTQIYIRALQGALFPVELELLKLWPKSAYTLYTSETQIEELRRVSRRRVAQQRIGKTTIQTPQQALPRLRKLVKR